MNLKNLKFERNGQIYNIKIKYTYAQGKNELEEYVKKKNKWFFSYIHYIDKDVLQILIS